MRPCQSAAPSGLASWGRNVCSRESPREVRRPIPAARPPRTSARLEPQPRTPARAAGAGQQTQRGTYSAVRRTHDLLPTSLQPRVSARSESPCTRRPLRLESSPASNHSRHTLRPERQALDSERSAEHIWLHARRATCLPPPCSRESPRGVSRPMPAARPPRTTTCLEQKPHNYIFKRLCHNKWLIFDEK